MSLVYIRTTNEGYEILAKANKANEQTVINILKNYMSRCSMKIRKITYPTSLDEVADVLNDNIDVFVETEEGMHFTMTVCTPLFYLSYMEKEGIDYIPASPPDIIVKELTHDNILRAIESFCEEEGYWMKAYYLLGTTDEFYSREDMDKMIYSLNKNT